MSVMDSFLTKAYIFNQIKIISKNIQISVYMTYHMMLSGTFNAIAGKSMWARTTLEPK